MKKNFFIVAALVFMSVVLIGGCSCAGSDLELVTITDYTEGNKGYTFQFSATETQSNKDGIHCPVKGQDVTLQFYLNDDWKENYPGSFDIVVLPKAYFDLSEEELEQLQDRFEIRRDEEIAKDDGRSVDTIETELFLDPEFKPYAQIEAKKRVGGGSEYTYTISSLSVDIGFVVQGISLNEPVVNIDGSRYSDYFEVSIDGGEFEDASHLRIKKSYRESVSITLRAKDSKYEVPNNIY